MRSVLSDRRVFGRRRACLTERACVAAIDRLAGPSSPSEILKPMLTDAGPVELWATRWRCPSAAANPQGFCGPATPRLTHFVTRVMLIRLIDIPAEENRPEQIR